jgi:hypothetical protein
VGTAIPTLETPAQLVVFAIGEDQFAVSSIFAVVALPRAIRPNG